MYDNQKVDTYIMCTRKYFPENKIGAIKDGLNKLDDTTFYTTISSVKLKDPSMMLLISIFLGGLGVDRFMLGGYLDRHTKTANSRIVWNTNYY